MQTVFEPHPVIAVPILGQEATFPVRRIYCVGRNYLSHAREMGADEREPPFFFTKFADTIVLSGSTLSYPPPNAGLSLRRRTRHRDWCACIRGDGRRCT